MTIETRSGKVVDSPYTNEEALGLLRGMVESGELYGDFAKKLAAMDHWSDEQLKWVHVLVVEAKARADKGGSEVKVGESLAPVIDLLEGAGEHLQYPKIRLAVVVPCENEDAATEPIHFKLYRAGDRSKYRGQVQVVEDAPGKVNYEGVPFSEQNRWFGRIDLDGVFHPSRKLDGEEYTAVVGVLKDFAADPAGVAGKVGRWLGRCCFCHRALSDERSTEVGYGPVCASHYGLEWGKVEIEEYSVKQDCVKEASALAMEEEESVSDYMDRVDEERYQEEKEMQEMEAEGDRAQTQREERAKEEARAAMEFEAASAHWNDGL